jgi:hypothetical protein
MSLKRPKSSKNSFMKLPRYSLKVALMILNILMECCSNQMA